MLALIAPPPPAIVPILFGVAVVTFLLMRLVPGDITLTLLGPFATETSRAALREYYGLDLPLHVQFVKWLWSVLQGNFGRSIAYQIPVADILAQRIGNTLILTAAAAGLAIAIGFVGGTLAGIRRFSLFDRASTLLTLVAASAPTFWIGLLLLYVFALELRWLPATGMYSIGHEGELLNLLWHLPLPAFSASLVSMAVIFRLTRSGLLEVMSQDYIRAARARGLSEVRVVRTYALRTLIPPVVNIAGLQVGFIFGASLFAEVIFQWPGVGLLMYNAVLARDVPVIQAVLLVFAVVFVLANLVTDLVTAALNPRARAGVAGGIVS
jgi:peptide/nickel transport system permease protein